MEGGGGGGGGGCGAGLNSPYGEELLVFTQHKYIPERERAIVVQSSGAV